MSAAPATAAAAAAYIAISPVEGIKPPVVMLGGVPVGVLMSDASKLPVDPVRAVGAQGRLGRDGELGLGGGHLVDVQTLGLDRRGTRALKGGVALGRLELADLQLARVHARDGHAAVLAPW